MWLCCQKGEVFVEMYVSFVSGVTRSSIHGCPLSSCGRSQGGSARYVQRRTLNAVLSSRRVTKVDGVRGYVEMTRNRNISVVMFTSESCKACVAMEKHFNVCFDSLLEAGEKVGGRQRLR